MNKIQYLTTKEKIRVSEYKDRYEYRPGAKCPWLQKICFKILARLGAYAVGETIGYETYAIDVQNVVETLYMQCDAVRGYHGEQLGCIVMGREDYIRMMRCEAPYLYFVIDATSVKFCDIKIHVIPWMSGVIVLPRGVLL